MNYFKKMLGIRHNLDDGFNHAIYGKYKGGYVGGIRKKAAIKADKRMQKKWVKNHENKLMQREELEYRIDSSSDSSEHICSEKQEYLDKHYNVDEQKFTSED